MIMVATAAAMNAAMISGFAKRYSVRPTASRASGPVRAHIERRGLDPEVGQPEDLQGGAFVWTFGSAGCGGLL